MDQRATRPVEADRAPGGLALALSLIALAGWVDALGVVQWHGLYVSFMSGNSTDLGAAAVLGDWHAGRQAGGAVLVFLAGTVAGEIIGPAAGAWRGAAVVGAEAALLWLGFASALMGWGEPVTAAITGFALGLQTAALHKVGGTSVALTYVTGTLVTVGRGIAAALRGTGSWRKPLPSIACWAALVAGAAAGAAVARVATADALGAAAAMATAIALVSMASVASRRHSDV